MQPSFPSKIWPLLVLAAAAPVGAQETPPAADAPRDPKGAPTPIVVPEVVAEPEVSVDELVQRALANNPQLPIARQTQEAARQRLNAVRSFQNPTLELVPRVIGSREAADSEVILSQLIDLFGRRRAQTGVAAAELRGAQAQSTLVERSLVVAVKNAAADLFAAQEAESLGGVQLEIAQLFRDAAARRAELGDVPPVQVQRAELELLRVQNELTNAQAERLARRAGLNQLIGQAPETPLRVALPLVSGLTDLLRVRPGPFRPGATTGGIPATGATGTGALTAPNVTTPNVAAGAAGSGIGNASGAIPAVPPGAGTVPVAPAAPGVATPGGTLGGLSGRGGVDVTEAVAIDRLTRHVGLDLAPLGQRHEGPHRDGGRVDLEVPTQGSAGVREPPAVGAERGEVPGDPRQDLVLHRAHEVGHGHERSAGAVELAGDVGDLLLAVGVHEVVPVALEAVTAQLGPRGHRPHRCLHVPVRVQQPLRLQRPLHRHA